MCHERRNWFTPQKTMHLNWWLCQKEEKQLEKNGFMLLKKMLKEGNFMVVKETAAALSTFEAEYIGLATTVPENIYPSQLLNSMDNRE